MEESTGAASATPATGTTGNDADAASNRRRLFFGSCMALIATSVAFAVVGAVTLALKREFVLTNAEVGWIIGAALWGFAVSQLIFAPLCDNLGFRFLIRLAFLAHLLGAALMIGAGGFWLLFTGALVIAMANGLVEAACNPLVATLYPEKKTVKLNQFHVWFPGGIVLGAVAAYLFDAVGIGFWQLKLGLIFVPTLAYGALLLFQHFPDSENVQEGISMREMFRATFLTPFMWLMLFCMIITASTELGPNRWVPAVLAAGGIPGILVLAWINGLMAVIRYNSQHTVGRYSPMLILLLSAVISTIGLFWLSFAETTIVAVLAGTVFAVGVACFWPTMLGVVAERVPRSGALGLGLMGALGMAFVGLVTTPQMGAIADEYAHERLPEAQTVQVLRQAAERFPALAEQAPSELQRDLASAAATASRALELYRTSGTLPEPATTNALRAVAESRVAVSATGASLPTAVERAPEILGPAQNYGGRMSFRYVVPFSALLIFIFGALYARGRRRESRSQRGQEEAMANAPVR